MMTSILYSSYNCPHSLKVAYFLGIKGLSFDRVEVDLAAKEQKSPAYLQKNPRGTVPAYETEKGVMGDSLDIMRYIDAHTSGPRLFPDDPELLATALSWIERADTDFWDVSHHLYWQLVEPPAGGTDWDEVARLKAKGINLLIEIEDLLSVQPYVVGDFSVADIVLLPWVYGFQRFDLPEPGQFPHIEQWRDALSSADAFMSNYRVKGTPFATFKAATHPGA